MVINMNVLDIGTFSKEELHAKPNYNYILIQGCLVRIKLERGELM